MPYCNSTLNDIQPNQVQDILSEFTRDSFVGGIEAYPLHLSWYAIDAGENDIRAVYVEDKCQIKFFCRNYNEMRLYEKKIARFAKIKGINFSRK